MRPVLHVTNGDSAVGALRRAGIQGDVIAWREVLHEGPAGTKVPGTFVHEERVRVACGHACEEVVLWFGSDLPDHLSILQILSRRPPRARLALAGVDEWVGISQLEPEELRHLLEEAPPVDDAMLDTAQAAWQAFKTDPRRLADLDTSAIPGLGGAVSRLLEEIPSERDGLSRSERQLLQAVAEGASTKEEAFTTAQRREERPWLGDVWAFERLARMTPDLLTADLALTGRGRGVLEGREAWGDRPPLQLGGGVFSGPASAT